MRWMHRLYYLGCHIWGAKRRNHVFFFLPHPYLQKPPDFGTCSALYSLPLQKKSLDAIGVKKFKNG